jgi:hypothetical protein
VRIPVSPGKGQGKPFTIAPKVIERHMLYKSLLTLMLTLNGRRIQRNAVWRFEQ